MSDRPGLALRYDAPIWLGLLGLALALRAYHLPGFVVNKMKATGCSTRWHPQLLFEPLRNSYPRPDILFPPARFRVDKASRPKRTCLAIVAGAVRDAIAAAPRERNL